MKDKLLKFGPIIMFVAVLGISAGLVYMTYEKPEDLATEKRFDQSLTTINAKLNAKAVDPAYPYSPEKAEDLKHMSQIVESNVTRPTRTIDDKVGVWVSYVQPTRPRSDAIIKDQEPVDVYAEMKPLTKIEALPDQGAIFVKCDIPEPQDLKMMELVRIEVIRGTDEKKIDKLIGTIELAPEEPIKPGTATAPATPAAPAAETPRRRGEGSVTPTPATPSGGRGAGNKPPAVVVPKFTKTFKDTNVEQKTTYYYKLRLVGRFTSTEGKFEPNKKADGTIAPGPGFKYHAPPAKDYVAVTPHTAGSTVQLYAPVAPTETVKALTPTNFTLRLEGLIGTAPTPGKPRDPRNPLNRDYAARFEVRAWIAELGEWKNDHIEVRESDTLAGSIKYRPKGGTENKTVEYTNELGYKFLEVVFEEDKKVKGLQNEVGILENQKTKQKESYPKSPNLPARLEALKTLDAIWKEQEEMKKKSTEVMKANIEKNKADSAAKAPPAAQ